jgi:cytochrome c oxidase subunit 2
VRAFLGLPVEASRHAPAVDGLIVGVHWLILVLAVAFGVFFIYCLARFNRRANPRARRGGVPPAIAWVVVGAIAVIELWELFFTAIPLWASRVSDFPAPENATIVRVVAEQFAWNVHYAGADGKFGRTDASLISPDNPLGIDRSDPAAKDDVTTINELEFPLGRAVIVQLSSKDVIHSFSLPEMRVKQDAIPGMMIPVWFFPTAATPDGVRWEINCSQLCGMAHYRMRGFYRSVSTDEFSRFLRDHAAAVR